MNIGIFLGYGPQVILNKEGLGRYIAGLIKGFIANGNQVTIACPNWLMDSVKCLCDDFGIQLNKIKFITTDGNPALWDVYSFLYKKKTKNLKLSSIKHFCMKIAHKKMMKLPRIRNKILFFMCTSIYAVNSFFIVFFICLLLLSKLFGNRAKIYFKNNKIAHYIVKYFCIRHIDLPLILFEKMYENEVEVLVSKINSEEMRDVWFVPALFWPQVCKITNGTVVINAPDLVSEKFPLGFAGVYNADNAIESCRKTLQHGKYFITYCDYIKQKLLKDKFSKLDEYVLSISHINNSMLNYINIGQGVNQQTGVKENLNNKFSHILLNIAMAKSSMSYGYLYRMNMVSVKYIFYASQCRPSKNIMNLLRAYEFLLHNKFIRHKLFLTVSRPSKEMKQYITEHNLENDVICFAGVSAQTLAALYCCADLVVNPTLYEGGFPFTFGEGMSVGTPSIMSDIPQVREVLAPAGLENMMFNPYSWKAIAEKIEWGLSNADLLYEQQLKLYKMMEKRTSDKVAEEYEEAFRYFISIDGR
ncbi:glycosyltransferase family 4 protein [Veillonellaceae bacterium WCA-693-APC-5D-A]|uniref:Glycosyltransferase family 4 protein n=1 Tax=Anaerovibrio slackiae TaxID=2652309 RepID=A0A6I2UJL6_9FIRM|nr:glycosyltransferase [Anaerovibrio slackiae]MSU09381.1 glycosyltransferase family 4 protein [Anaerovibrio slackiae]